MDYLWYALLIFITIGLLLLVIASIRAVWLEADIKSVTLVEISKEKQELYGSKLAQMIQIETVSYRDSFDLQKFLRLQETMKGLFPNLFSVVEETKFQNGAFVWKWSGKSSSMPLVLMAHQDVVPALEKGWRYPAFGGHIKDGILYGRGAMDTKNTLFAFLQAADELVQEQFLPQYDIYFCSSADEEVSGDGAASIVRWMKEKNLRIAVVLDEGGAVVQDALPTAKQATALVGIFEKGYVNIRVSAKSTGGHASMPKSNSPIVRLAKFVQHIERHYPLQTKMLPEVRQLFEKVAPSMSFGYRFLFGNMWLFQGLLTKLLPVINPYGRALLSTTIAFTMISGSEAENVIPSTATLICNVRTHPAQGIESTMKALQKIANKYDLSLEALNGREASQKTEINSPGYRYLESIIQENYPDAVVAPYLMLGGTDSREYCEVSDTVLRFSPMRSTNQELKKIHGIDESISLTNLAQSVLFYRHFIQKYHLKEGTK